MSALETKAVPDTKPGSGVSQALRALCRDEEFSMSPPRSTEVEFRVAATLEDYEAAFRIAYEVYHPLGYTAFDPSGLRVSSHQLRASTLVLLGFRKAEPVATVSVYSDGLEGLPEDAGRRHDLDALRATGRRLFECGTLMVRPDLGAGATDKNTCLKLFRLAWLFVRAEPHACLCAFVQARHALFYERLLGFRRIGSPRRYQRRGLNIPDVLPLALDLDQAEEAYRTRYEPLGTSTRNLYRFFCEEGPRIAEPLLAQGLRQRQYLDFEALRKRFGGLCHSPEATPNAQLCSV